MNDSKRNATIYASSVIFFTIWIPFAVLSLNNEFIDIADILIAILIITLIGVFLFLALRFLHHFFDSQQALVNSKALAIWLFIKPTLIFFSAFIFLLSLIFLDKKNKYMDAYEDVESFYSCVVHISEKPGDLKKLSRLASESKDQKLIQKSDDLIAKIKAINICESKL